ncbi:MAG TPA: DUF2142 domain-containing protein [Fimbriimonadaceae bacterium]|jgi:4-amino-4-deoxy-L-arabinose transferase-like glycosyltransferase
MNVQSNRFALAVLVLLHFVLAMAYAFDTPYRASGRYYGTVIKDFGAPDERQHANYIQWLADGKGFPVLDPKDPTNYEHYQSHQPPLFYIVSVPILKIAGGDVNNKAVGLALRSLNAVIGSFTVLAVFFLGYWGFKRKEVGLAAAAFAALLPMNLALSGAISNDPLLFCLCTWCLAITAHALQNGWTMKKGVILGMLMGLAFLTKTTAIALAPAILIAAYLSGAPRPSGKIFLATAGIALVLALPWWVRNQSLYGDPFAMKAFNQAFLGSPTKTSLGWDWGTYILKDFDFTWRSFIGTFGYMDIPLPDKLARIAMAVLALLALGGMIALTKPENKESRPVTVLNSVFLLLVILSFVAFNVKYFQGQSRYLFPALGPISIGFGLGLVYFSKEKWKTSFIAYTIVLVALNLWIVQQFLPEQFAMRIVSNR